MVREVPAKVPLDAQIIPSNRPQTLKQPVGWDIEPDDMASAVESRAKTGVGDDTIRCDDPRETGSCVRLGRPTQAGHGIGAPGGLPGQVDEGGPMALGERSAHGAAATSWRSNEDGFHRVNYAATDPLAWCSATVVWVGASSAVAGGQARHQEDGRSACGV